MSYRNIPRQVNVYPFLKRLRSFVSRGHGVRLKKSQSAHFVTFAGQRFKRLILRDSFLAAQIERNLMLFGPSDLIPPFVIRYEHEIWVEYVEGERPSRGDETTARKVAAFYAAVNGRRTRLVALDDTPYDGRLQLDLRFLNKVGVLEDATYRRICDAAVEIRPARVRVGFDYTDPVLKNFVQRPPNGTICAVDVESLEDQQLIGTGAAKALLRWMQPHRSIFFDSYSAAGGPDIRRDFTYIELCFLAWYMKLMFMERKWRHVQPETFHRLFAEMPADHR